MTVDEGVGPVPIRVERLADALPRIWLTTPEVTFGATVSREDAARALGLATGDLLPDAQPRYASAGSPFLFVALRDAATVDRAAFVAGTLPEPRCPELVGVFLFAPQHDGSGTAPAVYARMFAPWSGIPEDPATGGATGPLAAYLLREGLLASEPLVEFVSEQGTRMGRRSLLHLRVTNGASHGRRIEVGGSAVPLARGRLTLPD